MQLYNLIKMKKLIFEKYREKIKVEENPFAKKI